MQKNGMFDSIELKEVLKHLAMTEEDFLHMCIIVGCDYLPNIKCVGINKAKKIVMQEDDLMKALLALKNVPEGSKFALITNGQRQRKSSNNVVDKLQARSNRGVLFYRFRQ